MNRLKVITIAVAATLSAWAQSNDALLNKLVQKGILTDAEARELKKESGTDFNKAYTAKTGLPAWIDSLKIKADFRGRYDGIFADDARFEDRHSMRYRLRVGAVATFKDNFELGFRLTSGDPVGAFGGNPISGNSIMRDNGSKKFLWIDQAYSAWTPLKGDPIGLNLTFGKMENPLIGSELAFDGDYTPEGLAARLSYQLAPAHVLRLHTGFFAIDEIPTTGDDPLLFASQLRWEAAWNKSWKSGIGAGILALSSAERLNNAAVPNVNVGNTRTATGALANSFNPITAEAELTYSLENFPLYTGAFPITARGEFLYNPAASTENKAYLLGISFGKAAKKGTWELSYRWRYVEADVWFEEFFESDIGAFHGDAAPNSGLATASGLAGTSIKGHVIRGIYAPYDSITVGITYYLHDSITPLPATVDSTLQRIQVDAIWKF